MESFENRNIPVALAPGEIDGNLQRAGWDEAAAIDPARLKGASCEFCRLEGDFVAWTANRAEGRGMEFTGDRGVGCG